MDIGGLGSLLNLLVSGLQLAVGDVLSAGSIEEKSLLENHCDLAAQRALGHSADIYAVYQDLALQRLIESRDEIDDAGFAGSTSPYQSHPLPRLGCQVDVPEHHFACGIAEADPLQFHFPFYCG